MIEYITLMIFQIRPARRSVTHHQHRRIIMGAYDNQCVHTRPGAAIAEELLGHK
jgi:hypothetical protein